MSWWSRIRRGVRMRRIALLATVLALALAGVAAAASETDEPVRYAAPGGAEVGLRPTGVGLPNIGETATVGAGELIKALIAYHDSGEYESDLDAVDGAAETYLNAHLPSGRAKAAIVLDIDETSLSNYAGLLASGFTAEGTVAPAVSGTGTAIAPTLTLYRDAIAHHVSVFFVTGRPPEIQEITETNLRNVGYDEGWSGIYFKPTEADTEQFKSSTRAAIKKLGYRIIVNVGDQQSDLDGGYAQRDFKLPDPFYYIPD
jgi:HAD superfamily, subfamily IIIB (Acid phosphatase)